MAAPSISVEGLKEAQTALRKAGGTPEDQAKLNRDVVDKLIVPRAKVEVPVRSGALKRSIRSESTPVYGAVLAGLAGLVPYAGVIHFGWSTRGLGRSVSGTAKARRAALGSALRQTQTAGSQGSLTSRATNKAVRHALGSKNRGAVRGGPIKPNPFVYSAIDSRQDAVFGEFERQILQRAEIEGLL